MIKVYFESSSYAECVATFDSDALYMACLPELEKIATSRGMIVTECEVNTDEEYEALMDVIDDIETKKEFEDIDMIRQSYENQIERLNGISEMFHPNYKHLPIKAKYSCLDWSSLDFGGDPQAMRDFFEEHNDTINQFINDLKDEGKY